ncbi:hypothetical protein ISCGN_020522 [Ixodes scapularis]
MNMTAGDSSFVILSLKNNLSMAGAVLKHPLAYLMLNIQNAAIRAAMPSLMLIARKISVDSAWTKRCPESSRPSPWNTTQGRPHGMRLRSVVRAGGSHII